MLTVLIWEKVFDGNHYIHVLAQASGWAVSRNACHDLVVSSSFGPSEASHRDSGNCGRRAGLGWFGLVLDRE